MQASGSFRGKTSPEPSAATVSFGGVRVGLLLCRLGGRLLDFTIGTVAFPRLYKRRGGVNSVPSRALLTFGAFHYKALLSKVPPSCVIKMLIFLGVSGFVVYRTKQTTRLIEGSFEPFFLICISSLLCRYGIH